MLVLRLFLLCSIFAFSTAIIRMLTDHAANLFSAEVEHWLNNGVESSFFNSTIDILRFPTDLQKSDWRALSNGKDIAICIICKSVLKPLLDMRRRGLSDEGIRRKTTKLCTILNLQTKEVCEGVINLNLPILLHIVDSRPNLTSTTICGVLLESPSCPLRDPQYDWTVSIDNGPPQTSLPSRGDNLKILQLTDIHYDPNYEVNGNAACAEPTCCRKGQNKTGVTKLAGYWGDYGDCDTPWHAVEDALQHITDTHSEFDYVYFTGDIIDHGVWETSKEGNIDSLDKIYRKISETFVVPVYPILGNHEPHPLNQFAPRSVTREDLSTQWLYEYLSDLWIGYGWIPESAKATILQGGFYTVSPKDGFRVIVLNSNVCYSYNWWLLYAPQDPDGQLQWLADTLLEAEKNRESVHILTHIPASDKNCLFTWKREYHKIVARFSHIIKAQFNGHTHFDELQVFYDEEKKPINIAWNGGSLTSYTQLNPNYKIYDVDGKDLRVINYQNWMYNLSAANLYPNERPSWYKSYSFKEEYDLEDLSVESLNGFLVNASRSDSVLNTYYNHFFKHAQPRLKSECTSSCKEQYLCRAVASTLHNCKNILTPQ